VEAKPELLLDDWDINAILVYFDVLLALASTKLGEQ
jgi:hypothetical protein